MNWLSSSAIRPLETRKKRQDDPYMGKLLRFLILIGGTLFLAGCDSLTTGVVAATSDNDDKVYRLEYVVSLRPADEGAWITLNLTQSRALLRQLEFTADTARYSEFSGEGSLTIASDRVTWQPPAAGGALRWFVKIRHSRDEHEFDAYIEPGWALFRGEDIIPRAASRTLKDARSDSYLRFELPDDWSVISEYAARDGRFLVSKPERRFASPSGWILAGKIGTRTEMVAGTRVTIAAPTGHAIRRMDMIAFLHWTLPEIIRVLPEFPQRLTVVSAGDPMWRGGLSAERSFFIHGDRPLISENGTSAPLHEVMHVGLGISAEPGNDWIVEGLAEFYGIEILRRSGSVSQKRFERTLKNLAAWGEDAKTLRVTAASGRITARAVTVFAALDQEIRSATEDRFSLDEVARSLARSEKPVSYQQLNATVTSLIGGQADSLLPANLPGFE